MKALLMPDGNLNFKLIQGIEEFEQRILNSLNIYSVETFWDTTKGVNFSVISSRESDYKLEHLRNKLVEWFGNEASFSKILNKHKVGKTIKGTIQYNHKIYGESEVQISG